MPDAVAARRDADFLIEIGSRLSGSLNVRRCAQITGELAVPRLADVAVVLLPAGDGQIGWLRVTAENAADDPRRASAEGLVEGTGPGAHGGESSGDAGPGHTAARGDRSASAAGGGEASGGDGSRRAAIEGPVKRIEEGRVPEAEADAVPGLGEALAGLPGGPYRPDSGDMPDWLLPRGFGKTTSLAVVTLPGNAGPVGALLLARGKDRGEADGGALTLIRALALRAGAAIAAAVLFQEQSRINAILTADLMPPPLPRVAGVELAGSLRASQQAGQVGGDFYDAHWIAARRVDREAAERADAGDGGADRRALERTDAGDGGADRGALERTDAGDGGADRGAAGRMDAGDGGADRRAAGRMDAGHDGVDREDVGGPGRGAGGGRELLLAVGDVCGKGAEAAVLAGRVRHGLRALVLTENRPERLLALLNRTLLDAPGPCRLVTAVLAVLRTRGDRVAVDFAVAGHPPPLVLRRDGSVAEVDAGGTLLGLLDEVENPTVTVELEPGEVCLLYSDGITEAFGGPLGRQMFGEERLKEALATCAGMPARALVERLEQLSTEWLAYGERDDRTLLAIRAAPRPGETTR
jgi:serine phosphatase RsbU (regulator of sigma subunit)